jgi:hypothetical protein
MKRSMGAEFVLPPLFQQRYRAYVVLELLFRETLWQTEPSGLSQIGTCVPLFRLARDCIIVEVGGPPKVGPKDQVPKKGELQQCVLGKKASLSLSC